MEVIRDYGSLPTEVKRQLVLSPIITLMLINGVVVVVPVSLPTGIQAMLDELEEKAGEGLVR